MRKRRSPSPPSTPADAKMDRQGLWGVEQAVGSVRKAGKRRRAKTVPRKLTGTSGFQAAACQTKHFNPHDTPLRPTRTSV